MRPIPSLLHLSIIFTNFTFNKLNCQPINLTNTQKEHLKINLTNTLNENFNLSEQKFLRNNRHFKRRSYKSYKTTTMEMYGQKEDVIDETPSKNQKTLKFSGYKTHSRLKMHNYRKHEAKRRKNYKISARNRKMLEEMRVRAEKSRAQ